MWYEILNLIFAYLLLFLCICITAWALYYGFKFLKKGRLNNSKYKGLSRKEKKKAIREDNKKLRDHIMGRDEINDGSKSEEK